MTHTSTQSRLLSQTRFLPTRPEENSMLKITFSETPAEERWILHGRLVHPWVQELRTCWKKNHRAEARRVCIVDLNEVTFIDKSGERLLRKLAKAREL
jgi:anti-anti-sigma regulatory factor